MARLIETVLRRTLEVVCIALLVTLTACVVYATVMRYLGYSPSWYDEIASVLLAWLTYYGAAYAMMNRQHMAFSGLLLALPRAAGLTLFILCEALVLLFFGIVAWYGYKILPVARFDALLSLPWLSLDIVQSVIPVTAVLMIAAVLLTLPAAFRNIIAGVDQELSEVEAAIREAEEDARRLARNDAKGGMK